MIIKKGKATLSATLAISRKMRVLLSRYSRGILSVKSVWIPGFRIAPYKDFFPGVVLDVSYYCNRFFPILRTDAKGVGESLLKNFFDLPPFFSCLRIRIKVCFRFHFEFF